MRFHMLMAGTAALAFATGAIAQEAVAPAAPDAATMPAPADATTPASPADAAAAAPTDTTNTANAATTTAPAADAAASATATPSTDAATAAAPPATDAATAATAPAADTATAAAAPAAGALDPAKAQAADQMIAQNWSKYDAGGKGQLTPLEFGAWVLAAQGNDMSAQIEKTKQSRQANLPATKVLNATAAEFSKADSNKDRTISQDELRTYLAG
jgi:hypothetical protein